MFDLKKARRKINWKQGSGELLGFVCITPFIILLICAIVSAAQVGVINQKLSHAAYNCGRAAAISETETIGTQRAQKIYYETMGDSNNSTSYIPCEVEVMNDEEWQKGSYIKCTVRCYIDVLMPFTSGVREQSIVMMIENGDLDKS